MAYQYLWPAGTARYVLPGHMKQWLINACNERGLASSGLRKAQLIDALVAWENECGQDFMAGTICSLAPGHDGPHGTECQRCGVDWYMEGNCACDDGKPRCQWKDCNGELEDTDMDAWCEPHMCQEVANTDYFCNDRLGHVGQHDHRNRRIVAPTEEELAEVYRSLGVAPPTR